MGRLLSSGYSELGTPYSRSSSGCLGYDLNGEKQGRALHMGMIKCLLCQAAESLLEEWHWPTLKAAASSGITVVYT